MVLRRADELGAEIDHLAAGNGAVEHPAADAIARLDDRDGVPGARDLAGRDEAGEASADDDDILLAPHAAACRRGPLGGARSRGAGGARRGGRGRRGGAGDEAAAADASVLAHPCTITAPGARVKRQR